MLLLAFALWLTATVVVALPVCALLRRVEEPEEPVDEVELGQAMKRHPSRQGRAA